MSNSKKFIQSGFGGAKMVLIIGSTKLNRPNLQKINVYWLLKAYLKIHFPVIATFFRHLLCLLFIIFTRFLYY